MSAGISLMYRLSGGCDRHHICGECERFIVIEGDDSFGRGVVKHCCGRHSECVSSDGEAPRLWKASYMACKYFAERTRRGTRKRRLKKEH